MVGNFQQEISDIVKILNSPIDNIFKETAINSFKRKYDLLEDNTMAEVYYKTIEDTKARGIVYTPTDMAAYLIKNTISENHITNNPYLKIVDPACGTGSLLIQCFYHIKDIYINNLEKINKVNKLSLTLNSINKHIINNNLYGHDIDEKALEILKLDLFLISGVVSENLNHGDFLLIDSSINYDVVIGNPPYIGPKSMNKEYSIKLKELYKEVFKDKGDISYCFFKKAIDLLNDYGKLSFITSRYFLESLSGKALRGFIRENMQIVKLIDFYGVRPFKGIGIDPVIIFLEKTTDKANDIEVIKPLSNGCNKDKNFYSALLLNKVEDVQRFYVKPNSLGEDTWIVRDQKVKSIIDKIEEKSSYFLSDVCTSHQGIITGCDKAFVVNREIIEKEHLERNIIKYWIKSSYIKKNEVIRQDSYLIYSDLIEDETDYANSIKHISVYKEKLSQRRECIKGIRKWYGLQWGRNQEIFEESKIVFPFKSNSNTFAFDEGSYFSADVYALRLKEFTNYSYEFLLFLLNSNLYEFYFKTFAKKLGEDLYEYYPNNLMKLKIHIMENIKNHTEEELYRYFGINDEEIKIIEDNL